MSARDREKQLISEASQLFKTLGDRTRLHMLMLLKEKELNVTALAERLEMEQSAVSHQLQILRNTRLVRYRKEGKSVYYRLNDQHVVEIVEQVFEHVQEEEDRVDG